MTVYVDAPTWTKAGSKKPRKTYSHMVADTLKELHEFAALIGIKPHFFHKHRVASHYDITSDQQMVALGAGAKLVSSSEIVRIGKNQR